MFGIRIGTWPRKKGTPVVADLGIMYFNPTTGLTWSETDNWYFDSGYAAPANRIPQAGDLVYITGATYDGGLTVPVELAAFSGNLPTSMGNGSANLTITTTLSVSDGFFEGTSNVGATAQFNGNGVNSGTINGDADFLNSTLNSGTVSGNANFFNNANSGTGGVSGIASFYNNAINAASIYSCDFFDSSLNQGTTGNTNFMNASINEGQCLDTTTFSSTTENHGICDGLTTFSGSSINRLTGTINMNTTFNNDSLNEGTVDADATFNDNSSNAGTVTGTITCNTTGVCP